MFGSVNNYWELKAEHEKLQRDFNRLNEWHRRQDEVIGLLLEHLNLKVETSKTTLKLKKEEKDCK